MIHLLEMRQDMFFASNELASRIEGIYHAAKSATAIMSLDVWRETGSREVFRNAPFDPTAPHLGTCAIQICTGLCADVQDHIYSSMDKRKIEV